jgi:hypothetical protein
MRSQTQRDEQTLAIATAMGLFVVLLVLGGLVLWFISSVVPLSNRLSNGLLLTVAVIAGAVAIRNLVRAVKV